mmetsp:Transcript_37024/g.110544  ORF Transcript_37024/g.110544 Transcript_37024/m.110544 type:complete len:263 (+) Transcript_37024:38-826(+)
MQQLQYYCNAAAMQLPLVPSRPLLPHGAGGASASARPLPPSQRRGYEHDVADGAAAARAHHLHVRPGGLCERQLHAHHRLQGPAGHGVLQGGVRLRALLRRLGAQEHAADVDLSDHGRAGVHAHGLGPGPDDADAGPPAGERQVHGQVGVRGHLQDHVEALGRRLLQLRHVALHPVVHHKVGARCSHGLLAPRRACSARDEAAHVLCQLHGGQANGARGPVHQHPLPHRGAGAEPQGVVGGGAGHADACPLCEGHAVGQLED